MAEHLRLAVGFALAKGVIVAGTLAAIGVSFWQQLVVAVVSGSIGFAGVVVAARIAVREARKNRIMLEDVKSKVGADQRRRDHEEPRP